MSILCLELSFCENQTYPKPTLARMGLGTVFKRQRFRRYNLENSHTLEKSPYENSDKKKPLKKANENDSHLENEFKEKLHRPLLLNFHGVLLYLVKKIRNQDFTPMDSETFSNLSVEEQFNYLNHQITVLKDLLDQQSKTLNTLRNLVDFLSLIDHKD